MVDLNHLVKYKINVKIKVILCNDQIDTNELKSLKTQLLSSTSSSSLSLVSNKTIILFNNLSNHFIHGLLYYLTNSQAFRKRILKFFSKLNKINYKNYLYENKFNFSIVNQSKDYKLNLIFSNINYNDTIIQTWSVIVLYWMHKRKFYEAAWAYLSTLGGAYSSLGEEIDSFVCSFRIIFELIIKTISFPLNILRHCMQKLYQLDN